MPWFSNFGDEEVAVTSIPFAYLITIVHDMYSSIFLVEHKSILTMLVAENQAFVPKGVSRHISMNTHSN